MTNSNPFHNFTINPKPVTSYQIDQSESGEAKREVLDLADEKNIQAELDANNPDSPKYWDDE